MARPRVLTEAEVQDRLKKLIYRDSPQYSEADKMFKALLEKHAERAPSDLSPGEQKSSAVDADEKGSSVKMVIEKLKFTKEAVLSLALRPPVAASGIAQALGRVPVQAPPQPPAASVIATPVEPPPTVKL